MKLTFLGTGAADWNEQFRSHPGFRRNASMLAEADLLIDPGPNVPDYLGNGLLDQVEYILLTHSHVDHFSLDTLKMLCAAKPRRFFCHSEVAKTLPPIPGCTIVPIEPFMPVTFGAWRILPLPANHSTELETEQPLHYVLEKDGVRVFYGCDGGWILNRTWHAIRPLTFDLMIFDGTVGEMVGNFRNFEHNTLPMVRLLRQTFIENGQLKKDGRVMISHMARTLHAEHDVLIETLKADQITPAYDGMIVTV